MNTEQLRVGDAERDEVTAALHEHFAQGRLTRDELDERLSSTLSARTVAELRTVMRDLPSGGPAAPLTREWRPFGRRRGAWTMEGAGHGVIPHAWPRTARWGPLPRPFAAFLLAALVVAALTGRWWVIFPFLVCAWLAAAFTCLRRALRGARPSGG